VTHKPQPATSEAAEIAWPDTTRMSTEHAILTDAQALVDLGHAHWTEPDGVNSENSAGRLNSNSTNLNNRLLTFVGSISGTSGMRLRAVDGRRGSLTVGRRGCFGLAAPLARSRAALCTAALYR